MTPCAALASGVVERYFYDELDRSGREALEQHVRMCPECRHALHDLSVIREALAFRPDVAAPPADDWNGFMTRLDGAIRVERADGPQQPAVVSRLSIVPYLAMAALFVLITISVVYLFQRRSNVAPLDLETPTIAVLRPGVEAPAGTSVDEAFTSLSGEHFERSKLVVLGLANRDPAAPDASDWTYERRLATSLLSDTRLYRLTAEERGLDSLARVMSDLELVLLQTSLSEQPDRQSLEQIQRLIQKRDLVAKMQVVKAGL